MGNLLRWELYEQGQAVAVDAVGNVCTAGKTSSTTGIVLPENINLLLAGSIWWWRISGEVWSEWCKIMGNLLWWEISFDVINAVAVDPSEMWSSAEHDESGSDGFSRCLQDNTLPGFSKMLLLRSSIPAGSRVWGTYYGDTGPGCRNKLLQTDQSGEYLSRGNYAQFFNIASGGFQTHLEGGGTTDAFLVKFNSAGTRLWGTYLWWDPGRTEGFGVRTNGTMCFFPEMLNSNGANIIATPNGFKQIFQDQKMHF